MDSLHVGEKPQEAFKATMKQKQRDNFSLYCGIYE